MDDILSRIPEGAVWTIFLVIAFAIWGAPAIFSEEGSKKLYFFGRIARWIGTRQQRSIERERIVKGSLLEDLQAELRATREAGDATERRLTKKIADLDVKAEARSRKQERRIEQQMAWIEFSTGWARQVILLAAEHGWHPPLPEWVSFTVWQERNHRSENRDDFT